MRLLATSTPCTHTQYTHALVCAALYCHTQTGYYDPSSATLLFVSVCSGFWTAGIRRTVAWCWCWCWRMVLAQMLVLQQLSAYLAVHDVAALNLPQVVLLESHPCRNSTIQVSKVAVSVLAAHHNSTCTHNMLGDPSPNIQLTGLRQPGHETKKKTRRKNPIALHQIQRPISFM